MPFSEDIQISLLPKETRRARAHIHNLLGLRLPSEHLLHKKVLQLVVVRLVNGSEFEIFGSLVSSVFQKIEIAGQFRLIRLFFDDKFLYSE